MTDTNIEYFNRNVEINTQQMLLLSASTYFTLFQPYIHRKLLI